MRRQLRWPFGPTLLVLLIAAVPAMPAPAAAATYSIVPGGPPVTVTTGAVDENATVTFDGVIGQRISVGMTAVTIGTSICCGSKVSILKPDGTALVAPTNVGTSGGFIDTKTLATTGTYTIFVDPQGTATGNMTLTLHDVPPDAPGTIVPGGAAMTVTTTVPGQNARATFAGSAGQRVSLTVGPSCCSVRVSYLKPDGTTLGTVMTIGTFGGFVDTVTLPVAGTYTVLVDPQTTSTGSVTLRLYDVPSDVTGTIVAGGAATTLTTTVAGQNGRLTFTGTAGQRVSTSVGPTCCSVRVSLLRPDGTTLVAPTTIGTIGGFVDTVALPAAGIYTIVVDPQGTSAGSVTLRLYDVPPDVTGTIVTGGAPVTVTTIVPGQNGRLTFSGTVGQRVSIKLGPTCCSLRVSLLRPDGTTQVAPTSIATTGGFIDTTTLPVAGTYTIVVDPQGTTTGSVTVTLYSVAADVPGTIVPGGAPVTITTTVPGQNARLAFSGTAGQRVSIKVAPTCCSVKVSLLKPDGTTLAAPVSIGTAGGFVEPATLPVTGTYVLAIDPLTSSTGTLTVTLYDVPADVAGSIVAGGPAVSPTTTVPGQNARLTFSGTAGRRVSLNVGPSCCNVKVSLLSPDGTALVVPTTMGITGGFIDTKVLPATGTYTILVDPQSFATGSVTMRLYDVPPDATSSIVANGPSVALSLAVPGQNGSLTFDGTAGQRVSVRLTGVTIGTSVCCSSRVSLLKPDGTTLVSPVTFGTTGGFIDARTLPATGTYTIVIDPMTSSTGGVTVALADVPFDVTGTIPADGTPTTVGITAAGQNARLSFAATAAQRVSLQITASCCSGKVSLLKPDGTTLAPATTFGTAGVFVDAQTLPTAGTYTVLVDPDTSATGSITLRLYTVPPDASAGIVPGGAPATVTTTTPGQNGRLTFDGVIGQRVSARISTTCCSTRVTLLNPNGTALVPAKSFAVGTSFVDTATLPTSGVYTLLIDPQGVSVGSVTVTLYDVPPDAAALIGFGGSVNVTTTVPGQNVRVMFDGVGGDGVLVNTGPFNCCTTKMSILGPTGTTVAGPGSYGADGGVLFASLQASGTHEIFVDPQGPNIGVIHLGLSIDGTAPPPPTLTLSESSPDSHVANGVFYYRPTGAGSTFTVDAATTATGLAKMRFAGLGSGFTPTTPIDDPLAPYSQTYTWTPGATYNNTAVPVTAYDSVGRGAITTFGVIRDDAAPITTDNTATIGSGWKNTNQTVILSPLDGTGAGVAATYYTTDGSIPTTASPLGTSTTLSSDGVYTIRYFSVDNVQNVEIAKTASTQVHIDKTPPSSATLNPLPAVIRNGQVVTGSGTDAMSGVASISYFYCRGTSCAPTLLMGTSSTAPGYAVTWNVQPLDGTYQVLARVRDAAGNTLDSVKQTTTIDNTPPNTTITASPPPATNQTTATFQFTSTEAGSTFECTLDGSAFAPCTSPVSYSGLADGSHTFQVRATDPIGNLEPTPATYTWSVDSTPPDTSITATPAALSGPAVSFSFTSTDAGSTFACSLDGGAFATCTSPRSYTGLSDGSHTFAVRATDPAGNADPSAATYSWTVDAIAPDTTITTAAPTSPTTQTDAAFEFVASEGNVTFECSLDAAAFAPCTSPQTYSGLPEGARTFRVRALDAVGNPDPTPATYSWTIDLTAPNTTITAGPANPTNQTAASFSFTSTEAGSTFECRLDGAAFALCTSPRAYSGLAEGTHTFDVRATDPAGNTDATPATSTWRVDLTPPDTSITSTPANPTNQTSATFAFVSTEAGSTFQCSLDGAAFAACTSPRTYTGLAAGSHTFQVRATDPAGNTDSTPASHTWTIDTTAPNTTVDSGPPTPTNQTSATFTFSSTEAGSTFQCGLDGAAFVACTTPHTYTGLAAGSHTFRVRATDPAGNIDGSPAQYTWTIDLTAPNTTITAGPANPTNQTTANFSFTSTEAGSTFECKLDAAAFAPCTTPKAYSALTEGSHTFQVRATDPAGNTDATPAATTWTVDLTPPSAPLLTNPPENSFTNSATVTVTGTAEPNSTVTVFDGATSKGTATADAGGNWSRAITLADGAHTLTATATDPAGNVSGSSAARTVTVDTVAPNTTITSSPTSPTNATSATFAFTSTEAGSSFQCSLDAGAFVTCTSPTTYGALAEGSHTFRVRAIDQAGNVDASPAQLTWTVDLTAPNTTITTAPANPTNQTTAAFAFTATEAGSTFDCRLDGAAFASCTSPKSYSGLAEGSHTFDVRATDAAGNADPTPATNTWFVDLTPPDAPVIASPSDGTLTKNPTVTLSGTAEPNSTVTVYDGVVSKGTATADGLGTWTKPVAGVTDGVHTYTATAADVAGNVSPASAAVNVTVDTTGPDTAIASAPANPTNQTAATFAFTSPEAGATFECRLDGAAYAACTSPVSYSGLAPGSHTFSVRALDGLGNPDATPASYTWTVDVTPPETTIATGPANPTNATSASFGFSSSEAGSTFECRLDGAAFAACTSPKAYSGLAEGSHSFEVRATDAAGNTDPTAAVYTWTIDLTAPAAPAITSPPDGWLQNTTTVTLSGTAEPNSTITVYQNGVSQGTTAANAAGDWTKAVTGVPDGSRSYTATATDAAGNVSAASAARTVVVDTTAPNTTVTANPSNPTNQTTASFSFTSTEAGSTFACSLDGAAYSACTSPSSYSGLAAGSHTFNVRATDPAGNTDATPATYTWTIDLTAPNTTITASPTSPTTSTSASFSFSSSESGSTFECRLDGGAFGACASPKAYSALADGSHTFEVRAVDPAGNADPTPAAHTWTIDTTPPETTITAAPADPTNATSATFSFTSSEAGSTFRCSLDGANFQNCTSPRAHTGLAAGSHTFQVRATDALGNVDATPATYTWTIDLTGPNTTITSSPPNPSNTASPSFAFSSTEAGSSFECSLDGSPFAACTSTASYSALAEGAHTFRVRAIDPAGNVDASPAQVTWTIDLTAPNTTITSAPSSPTNQTSATFAFASTETGSSFECRLDGGAFAACTSPTSYSGLAGGNHAFEVRATDPAGNADQSAATHAWVVDLTAPNPPAITSPPDGTLTSNATVTLSGTAEPNSTVTVYDGVISKGTAAADALGNWTKVVAGATDGTHGYTATATDAAGNVSPASAAVNVTVDTTGPDTALTSTPANPTNQTTATFAFTSPETGASFECRLDGAAYAPCTSPVSYAGLAAGTHTFNARALDGLGNPDASPAAYTWTIDLTPPDTTVASGPGNPTNATSASFSFTSTEAGSTFECSLDGAALAPCSSPRSYTALAEGSHTFEVRATDPAGNTDTTPALFTWSIDLTAPDTTITAAPPTVTSATSASFSFTAPEAGSTFQCSLDGGAFAACTAPRTYTGLAAGTHTFQVRAVDPVGNADPTPASYTWTIDTTAPNTTITANPSNPTNQTTASFSFTSTEAGSTFACSLDGAAYSACASPSSYSGLAAGSHTFNVRATDPAGNTDATPATYTWTIDLTAPNTTITATPTSPTTSTSASFSFSSTETGSTFECRLDGAAFAVCTSPKAYSALADGSHTFEVRAVDPAGNADPTPAAHTWTIDTTPPETTITTGPANPTNQTSASFSFTSSEAGSSFRCSIDGGAFRPCTSPDPYTGLAAGSHTYQVRATDSLGNVDATPATYTWTVDLTAPNTTITSSPANPSNTASPSFGFTSTEAGSTFQCSLDGGAFASCASPRAYSGLADGSHTFQVRAIDAAGNTDATPASYTWTIDATSPNTTITSGPATVTTQASATFAFTSTEAGSTFQCSLDGGAFASCTSPRTYTGLVDGAHTFDVRAIDSVGNSDPTPAALAWTVDTSVPETTITGAPATPTKLTTASFSFSSSEAGSTFQCKLDAGPFTACTSPTGYSGLADGAHSFQVRASDTAGNIDATPASHAWTVDTTAPAAPTITSPADNSFNTSGTVIVSGSAEAGSTVDVFDGATAKGSTGTDGTGGWSKTLTTVADGSHTYTATATDPAGNTSAASNARTVTVDTAAPNTAITSAPTDPTNSTSAGFSFSSSEAGSSFQCKLDAGPFTACTSPTAYSGLADGAHSFQVRASDTAGNSDTTPATHAWTVDTTAPAAPTITSPADNSFNASGTVTVSGSAEAGSTVEVFDGAISKGGTSADGTGGWSKTLTTVADGSHTYTATATDPAGNTSAASNARTVTVDSAAPDTSITSAPADPTNSTSASFSFSSSEAGSTFQCKLDAGAFASCTSPAGYSGLTAATHTFQVRALDQAGNVDPTPATHTWTIETNTPETTITGQPPSRTNSTSATFAFSSSKPGSTFQCSLDAVQAACTSPRTYTGLAAGAHTFQVRATDAAGNVDPTPASYTWIVDQTAPDTAIGSAPADPTSATGAAFTFTSTEPGSSFECRLDGAAFSPCSSPKTYSSLSEGSHTFEVRATDLAGNTDATPASHTWTVDTTAPDTTITSAPLDPTTETTATFEFTSNQAGSLFECSLDGAPFAACTSPEAYTGVAAGPHTFRVRAVDTAGNTDASPATHAWTIA